MYYNSICGHTLAVCAHTHTHTHTHTVLRSLGLPARSVTNFNSAHDTDFNRAIDKNLDENGEEIDPDRGDSIWLVPYIYTLVKNTLHLMFVAVYFILFCNIMVTVYFVCSKSNINNFKKSEATLQSTACLVLSLHRNFHVWNDVWMERPDLPKGFGGWQAVDATPQEQSPQGGGFRTGPASLRAIKLGQKLNYDVEFVISEV